MDALLWRGAGPRRNCARQLIRWVCGTALGPAIPSLPVEALESRRYLSSIGPLDSPFPVDGGHSAFPAVATVHNGDFVVAWQNAGSGSSIVSAQRYSAAGEKQGPRIDVGTGEQPSVAMDVDGDFVVAWQKQMDSSEDQDIYARCYNRGGEPQGDAFRANSYTTGLQICSQVASDDQGNFVVIWFGDGPGGIFDLSGRRFANTGAPLGSQFTISADTQPDWQQRSVAMDADGDFVVTFDYGGDGPIPWGIYARRYSSSGSPQGGAFRVSDSQLDQGRSAVGISPTGNFVVAWGQNAPSGGYATYYRLYDAAGSPLGDVKTASQSMSAQLPKMSVSTRNDGSFAIAWASFSTYAGDSGNHAFVRWVDATGVPQGLQYQLDAPGSYRNTPVGVSVADNTLVVAWETRQFQFHNSEILAMRFGISDHPASVGDLVWDDLNANGLQDTGEPGRASLSVTLRNAAGTFIGNNTTSSDGHYRFDNLLPGQDMYLQFQDAGPDLLYALEDIGGDDQVDSDADHVTGCSALFSLAPDEVNTSLDAGYVAPANVNGTVWLDSNGNSMRDAGEIGLCGWIVYADLNSNGQHDSSEPSTVTVGGGVYTLRGIRPGPTCIALLPQAAWTVGAPQVVSPAWGQSLNGVDFGNQTTVSPVAIGPAAAERVLSLRSRYSDVAAYADGTTVVASLDNLGHVAIQRFDAGGFALGDPIFVNKTAAVQSPLLAVSVNANGDFVVIWNVSLSGKYALYARAYRADGTPKTEEFRINSDPTAHCVDADVAVCNDGGFVVTWRQNYSVSLCDVFMRLYDAAGNPLGTETRVNTATGGVPRMPKLAMDAAGNYVVTWEGKDLAGNSPALMARRFNVGGTALGDEFRVNPASPSVYGSEIAMGADGVFAVVWTRDDVPETYGIRLQRFSPAGNPIGGEIRVSETGLAPAVSIDSAGSILVLWAKTAKGQDIFAQLYNSAGVPLGPQRRINGYDTDTQTDASVAATPNGFVVIWESGNTAAGFDVRAQWCAVSAHPASIAGRAWSDVNDNGIQDPGETGINNLTVGLRYVGSDAFAIDSATAQGGVYAFPYVLPGPEVCIQFPALSGHAFAEQNAGVDPTLDSDVNATTGRTATLTLAPDEAKPSIDAGYVALAGISGIVYFDADRSGTQDAGEPDLPGWVAYVDADGNGQLDPSEPFAVSGSNASPYKIGNLRPRPTTIALLPQDHWTVAKPKTVNLVSGQVLSGVDFGCYTDVPNTLTNPAGGEFGVNTTTLGSQRHATVASDSNGNTVVIWESDGQDGDGLGVYARRHDAAGQPQGSEFRINTTTAGAQSAAAVAVDADGDFVVVWQSTTASGNGNGVYARRYDASGQAQGPEFPVATLAKEDLWMPSVAMDHDRDFVVTWQSHGADKLSDVWVRQYDQSGTALGDARPVTTESGVDQTSSAVAMDAAGNFVVAWTEAGKQGGIYAQRFNATGGLEGGTFRVTTDQVAPVLAMNSGGEFVVSWEGSLIQVQRYNQAGLPQGGALRLAGSTSRIRHTPSVAMADDGSFVVAWESYFQEYDLHAQRFNGAGMPQGQSRIVNTYVALDQRRPAVAMDADGDFVIVWDSKNQDKSAEGVYAQRYELVRPPDPMIVARDYDTYLRRDGDTVLVLFPPEHPTPALPIGLPAATFPLAALSSLWVNPASSTGRITVDPSGDPIPSGGLHIVSNIPKDSFSWVYVDLPSQVSTAPFAVYVHGKVTAGFQRSKTYGAIHLLDTSLARFGGAFAHVFRVGDLSIAPGARLDLQYADLIVQATPATRQAVAAAVFGHVKSARNAPGGLWTGTGITHTGAATDTFKGLVVALNDRGNGTPWLTELQGLPSDINDVVVMYTWNGDANLDGVVNADDYFLIDSNFIPQAKGYQNGDFNYDNVVNADDYLLIDSAFIGQSGPLSVGTAVEAATAPAGEQLPLQIQQRKDERPALLAELFSMQPIL